MILSPIMYEEYSKPIRCNVFIKNEHITVKKKDNLSLQIIIIIPQTAQRIKPVLLKTQP